MSSKTSSLSPDSLSPDIFHQFKDLRVDDFNRKYPNKRPRKYIRPMSPEWFYGCDHSFMTRADRFRKESAIKSEALPQFIDYPVNGKTYRVKAMKKHDDVKKFMKLN